ncbi:MerR family transcriptional regulator [Streptomyces sulphureus]|uniref:MerR family transcriptional regulator n=1 Tax=Streptomyces sulphureus TaxID=47758 RepID=UPI00036CB350|nr:MerR family transcriptional regulator [Streptomyces sulphureus]
MRLLTIGTFARAAGLSQKALRLYDGTGLLRPAHVDPATGYRYYAESQLAEARLVAWLRRLGMPLARITELRDLPPAEQAGAVRAFRSEREAAHAAWRDLASLLVDELTRRAEPMTAFRERETPLTLRYAAASATGRERPGNQDVAYADARLLAVADGFGPLGREASSAAVDALASGEAPAAPEGALATLRLLLDRASAAARATSDGAADTADAGTTLTALLLAGDRLALAHIGDTRAYLLRGDRFSRLTEDHTHVAALVGAGELTPEEAESHPQRTLLLRALTTGADASSYDAEFGLHETRAGDRFLLCSKGLGAAVPPWRVRTALTSHTEPSEAVAELMRLADAAGGPDNVACVVADVVGGSPTVVGAGGSPTAAGGPRLS